MININKRKESPGYTLMEIMIVVIVLGTIASLALPNFSRIMERQKCSNMKLKLRTALATAQTYYVRNLSVTINQIIPDSTTDPYFDYRPEYPNTISGIGSISGQRKSSSGFSYTCSAQPDAVIYCSPDNDQTLSICDCNYSTPCSF